MKRPSVSEQLERLKSLVLSAGVSPEVRRIVEDLLHRRLDRKDALALSQWARASHMPEVCLRLLHRRVRPPARSPLAADDEEKAEYGAALLRVGARREARTLLLEVDAARVPKVLLFLGFHHMASWDWTEAAGDLERLARHARATEYEKLAGSLYLGQALAEAGRFEEAEAIQLDVIARARRMDIRRTERIALLDRVQTHFYWKKHETAARLLREIPAELVGAESELYALQYAQWSALIDLAPGGGRDRGRALRELSRVSECFRKDSHWVDLRLLEFHRARILEDRETLLRLYFGTPFRAFRLAVERALGGPDRIPESFDWRLGKGTFVLDIETGENTTSDRFLKQGQTLQGMLKALCADLYQPAMISGLHESLYPGEHYDPDSSRIRMHQNLMRLRRWFGEAGVPLQIEERAGFYRIEGGGVLRLRKEGAAISPVVRMRAQELREAFGDSEFPIGGAAEVWKVSVRSANRFMLECLDVGMVQVQGKGSRTRYRIPSVIK